MYHFSKQHHNEVEDVLLWLMTILMTYIHDVLFTGLLSVHCCWLDSKTLSEASREKYFEKINCSSHLGWIVEILSPNYISNLMLRRCVCVCVCHYSFSRYQD